VIIGGSEQFLAQQDRSNSYSKMVARYRQDLLAVHAASEAAP